MHTRRSPIRSRLALTAVVGLAAALGTWRGSTATSMPDTVKIPVVQPHPNGIPAEAGIFRHHAHRQSVCYACHPTVFPRYRVGFTHAQMQQGRYCGACHDGRTAFAVTGEPCESCHVAP